MVVGYGFWGRITSQKKMTFELNYEVWLSWRRAGQVREKHKLRYPSGIKHDKSTSEWPA